jgi:hypothetical protein
MAVVSGLFRSLLGSSGRRRLAGHLVAHALQTLDKPTLHLVAIRPPEKLLSFLVILLPCLHHLIVDHQNTMTHC